MPYGTAHLPRKLSVRPSVRPSVTLRYNGRKSWVTSKVIKQITRLGSRFIDDSQMGKSSDFTCIRVGYGKVAAQSRKPAISLNRGKREQELLLTAYIKSYTNH